MPLVNRYYRFTLIELLIVVGIIAILAGMLLPALNKARDKGRAISCMNNFATAGKALSFYADDNDDYLPKSNTGMWYHNLQQSSSYPMCGYWPKEGKLNNYAQFAAINPARGTSAFACPAAIPSDDYKTPGDDAIGYYTMGINGRISNGQEANPKVAGIDRRSKFRYSSSLLLLADSYNRNVSYKVTMKQEGVAFRHGGSANILFADGHAKAMKEPEIPSGDSGYAGAFWNPLATSSKLRY